MGTKFNVAFRPPTGSNGKREYVDIHELEVSKVADAGKEKITFAAAEEAGGFVVVIPRANSLFTTTDKTLHSRVSSGTSYITPTINGNVNVGEKYEYHVFCEDERDWAHKPGSSPPKIIITG